MSYRLTTLVTLVVFVVSITTFVASAHAAQSLRAPTTADIYMQEESVGEVPPTNINPRTSLFAHSGNSTVDPLPKSDITYSQDTGTYYDQYLGRFDVPDGKITYNISIDRYFSPLMAQVDANGFLSNPQEVINKGILPAKAKLTMQVWDVDHEDSVCPEVDLVWVNDKPLLDANGDQVALTSGDVVWDIRSFDVPITMLKFPTAPGSGGAKPTKTNTITIRVNALNCTTASIGGVNWKIEVDWAAISFPPEDPPVRPILFVHGWKDGPDSWINFRNLADIDEIPNGAADMDEGLISLPDGANRFTSEVERFRKEMGVDKIDVIAHSRGGINGRLALQGGTARRVANFITLSSPHHGADELYFLP